MSEGAASDWQLVRDCLDRGRREAFDDLVERYQDRVHGLIARLVQDRERAADLAQEAFVKAWRALHRFRGDSAFFTWLYRIALNVARTEQRKAGGGARALRLVAAGEAGPGAVACDLPDRGAGPEDRTLRAEDRARIESAVGRLPSDFREVVVLRDIEDRSYEEIAGILEIPVGTVRSRLHRARLMLRSELGDLL